MRFLVILATLALIPAPASAQVRRPQITGDVIADTKANLGIGTKPAASKPVDLLAAMEAITIPDLEAAVSIFANNPNGLACAQAWLNLFKANAAAEAAKLPEPHLFSDLAKLYNLHVAMQSGAPLKTACAAMKDDLQSGLAVGGGLVGGGVTAITKLAPVLALFGL